MNDKTKFVEFVEFIELVEIAAGLAPLAMTGGDNRGVWRFFLPL